jgi:hypothetical protein
MIFKLNLRQAFFKFLNNIELIKNIYNLKNEFKKNKIDVFYFNQFLLNLSNQFFKNLTLKISHMNWIKKASDNPKRNKYIYIYIEAWLNQLPNIHILRRNPTNRWVDFKTTHQLDGCTQNLDMHVY